MALFLLGGDELSIKYLPGSKMVFLNLYIYAVREVSEHLLHSNPLILTSSLPIFNIAFTDSEQAPVF